MDCGNGKFTGGRKEGGEQLEAGPARWEVYLSEDRLNAYRQVGGTNAFASRSVVIHRALPRAFRKVYNPNAIAAIKNVGSMI